MELLGTIQGQDIYQQDDGTFQFISLIEVDGDGSPRCYGPAGVETLDYLANAGSSGNWYGVVVDKEGDPIVQGPSDPNPGYYISTTSLQIPGYSPNSPNRYLNSETVPYVVVPGKIAKAAKGIVLGCYCTVTDTRNGNTVEAVCGDTGPSNKMGEASIAVAEALGIPSSPKNGGCDDQVFVYKFWPGTPAPGYSLQPLC